jgi:hypothetical protein
MVCGNFNWNFVQYKTYSISVTEKRKIIDERSLLLSLFSLLANHKTAETKIPWMAAKRKILVQVSKES